MNSIIKMTPELKKYLLNGGSLGSLGKMPKPKKATLAFPCEALEVFEAQVSALSKRLKNIGVKDVVIGLSGGLDSALCFLVAVSAFIDLNLDFKGLHIYTMPGFGTSGRTKGNAGKLCEGFGIKLETIDIKKACRQHLKLIGHDGVTLDVTYENAQARMRTLVLMNKANMHRAIVLGTGDMSEIALGWCTYNGDHMSMFGVNAGVPKTIVRKVCTAWAELVQNEAPKESSLQITAKAILDIVDTPVSPELLKGQATENTIGPYELHDFFMWNFIQNGLSPAALIKSAKEFFKGQFSVETIRKTLDIFLSRLISQAFKRNCAPDGIKVFPFDFSSWKIPSDLPKIVFKMKEGKK